MSLLAYQLLSCKTRHPVTSISPAPPSSSCLLTLLISSIIAPDMFMKLVPNKQGNHCPMTWLTNCPAVTLCYTLLRPVTLHYTLLRPVTLCSTLLHSVTTKAVLCAGILKGMAEILPSMGDCCCRQRGNWWSAHKETLCKAAKGFPTMIFGSNKLSLDAPVVC